MSIQSTAGGGAASRTSPGGGALGEVLDRVLDKGIVIDAWASVSLLGIEILSIQAQVVVASVETYLKYAQAVGSLSAPQVEQPKIAAKAGAAEVSPSPASESLPSEDELVKYLGANTGGLRIEQLAEHFHAPKEQVEHALLHLIEEHKVRRDAARGLLLPEKG
jgi:gas vesicle structural protein